MIRVVHLIDDTNLGGINRTLEAQRDALGEDITAMVHVVNTRGLPPMQIDADVAIIHFTMSWRKLPFMLLLRALLGWRPLIIVEHSYTAGYEAHRVAHRGRFRAMLRLSLSLAGRVVAVSQGQAEWLRSSGIVPDAKLHVIPPASNMAPFAAIPPIASHGAPLRLGCYGRFAEQKGLFVLLDAMRLIPATCATLTLAGYGPDEAALCAATADMPNVWMQGPTRDPAGFVAEHDAIVMPSLWEAYGQVCAEARCGGRPVLVSDIDGLSEQVPDALRVAGPSAWALAERIVWLAGQDLRALGESLRASTADLQARHCASWSGLLREAAGHAA